MQLDADSITADKILHVVLWHIIILYINQRDSFLVIVKCFLVTERISDAPFSELIED